MGTVYYVACKDCRVVRDLDKFYTLREVAWPNAGITGPATQETAHGK